MLTEQVIAFFLREDAARRAARQPGPELAASTSSTSLFEECRLSATSTLPAGSNSYISEKNTVKKGHWQVGGPAGPVSLSLVKNFDSLHPTAAGHFEHKHQYTHQTTGGKKFWQKTVSKEQQAISAGSNRAATDFDAGSDGNTAATDSRNPPLMQRLGFQSDTTQQIANVDTLQQSAVQLRPGPDGKIAEVLGLGQDATALVNYPDTEEVRNGKIGGVVMAGMIAALLMLMVSTANKNQAYLLILINTMLSLYRIRL
jgi:hypothetical protein